MAIAAATVLALAFGTAHAAQPDMPPGGPGAHQMHGGHEGGPFGAIMKLHDQLKLNASQEQQWQAAVNTMKQNRDAMRKSHEQMRDQFKAQQNQPILDLSAMHSARQQAEAQNAQLREQTSAAWLTFYNGLNDQQKTMVSTALQQFAKMEQRHEKMKERWEQHRAAAASAPRSKPAGRSAASKGTRAPARVPRFRQRRTAAPRPPVRARTPPRPRHRSARRRPRTARSRTTCTRPAGTSNAAASSPSISPAKMRASAPIGSAPSPPPRRARAARFVIGSAAPPAPAGASQIRSRRSGSSRDALVCSA